MNINDKVHVLDNNKTCEFNGTIVSLKDGIVFVRDEEGLIYEIDPQYVKTGWKEDEKLPNLDGLMKTLEHYQIFEAEKNCFKKVGEFLNNTEKVVVVRCDDIRADIYPDGYLDIQVGNEMLHEGQPII